MTITKARLLTGRDSGSRGSAQLRARVRVEVDVLQPVGRQVRVELRGGDVGVAEHLLEAAQVAAPGEQMGGKAVAQRMRAHALGEAGARGVALDDLVGALAGEAGAALVDEQPRFEAIADEPRPALGE